MNNKTYWGHKAVYDGKGFFLGWAWYAIFNGDMVEYGISADADAAQANACSALKAKREAA